MALVCSSSLCFGACFPVARESQCLHWCSLCPPLNLLLPLPSAPGAALTRVPHARYHFCVDEEQLGVLACSPGPCLCFSPPPAGGPGGGGALTFPCLGLYLTLDDSSGSGNQEVRSAPS